MDAYNRPLLILDYDGTIHETRRLYACAVSDTVLWLKQELENRASDPPALSVLSDAGKAALEIRFREPPENAQLEKWIGMTPQAMWNDYAPELPEDLKASAIRRVGRHMDRHIREESRWYPHAEEILDQLAQDGFPMIVLSNCTESYAKTHWAHFSMARWFSAFLASDSFSDQPKEQIVQALLQEPETILKRAVCRRKVSDEAILKLLPERRKQGKVPAIVVGDRLSDLRAAKENGLPFIGCLYGYGSIEELAGADRLAADPRELAERIKSKTE